MELGLRRRIMHACKASFTQSLAGPQSRLQGADRPGLPELAENKLCLSYAGPTAAYKGLEPL